MAHSPERELSRRELTLQIRTARADEAGALANILRAASLANPGDTAWLLAHPEVMVVDGEHLLAGRVHVAERQRHQAVGFATVLPPQGGSAEIDGIFVAPSHWRQGVGRALLQVCAQQARAEGASALRVVVNPHALSFYAALGFELEPGAAPPEVAAGLALRLWRTLA